MSQFNIDNFEDLKKKIAEAAKGKSIIDDMLIRAESKIPKLPAEPPLSIPIPNVEGPPSWEQRVKGLEDQIKKLADMMLAAVEAQNPNATTATPSTETPSDAESIDLRVAKQETMQAASEALGSIVTEFNEKFVAWQAKSGCVANLGWSYGEHKQMDVLGIDVIVYRKQPPSSLTIKEALDKAPKESEVSPCLE